MLMVAFRQMNACLRSGVTYMLPKRVVSIAYDFELLAHPVLCPSLTVESFHKWKHETLSGLGLAGLQPVTG